MKKIQPYLTAIVPLLCLLILSGCLPVVAVRELLYRPSPSDPYHLWRAYITDSGLLYLCGSVDNGLEGMERVGRVYNLELRLEETLVPQHSDEVQIVQIEDHPSLQTTKGYLSDLCQFDDKRVKRRPNETGWTEIFMDSWDDGYMKVHKADLNSGDLPNLPTTPRVVLYQVQDTEPPEYLLMGQLRNESTVWKVLLILGNDHIDIMW